MKKQYITPVTELHQGMMTSHLLEATIEKKNFQNYGEKNETISGGKTDKVTDGSLTWTDSELDMGSKRNPWSSWE